MLTCNWLHRLAALAYISIVPVVPSGPARQHKPEVSSQDIGEARRRGEAILAAAVDAVGGRALEKVASLEFELRKQAATPQGTLASKMHLWVTYPNKVRIEECTVEDWLQGGRPAGGAHSGPAGMPTRASGPVTPMRMEERCVVSYAEGTDGLTAWRKTPSGTVELPLDDSPKLALELFGSLAFYRWAAEEKLEPILAGTHQLGARELLAVEVHVPASKVRAFKESETQVFGGTLTLYVDPKTDLIAGISFGEANKQVVETWDDYRRISFELEGRDYRIQFPFHWAVFRDGKQSVDVQVESLRLNRPPSPKVFARP